MDGSNRRTARALVGIATLGVVLPLVARTDTARASTGVNLHLTKTVGSAAISPVLSLNLGVNHTSAIPRDTLTYTATVTNTGSVLAISGDFTAQNTDTLTTATVSSYFDDVSTASNSMCGATLNNSGHTTVQWTPLAGTAATQPGYTPVTTAPITTGMQLHLVPVAASGVTYPSSGDLILGTRIAPSSTATWHYTATIALSPAQTATLVDKTKVSRIRNSFHVEPTPRSQNGSGQPPTVDVDFCQQYFSTNPSGAATNVSVTVTPQGASPVTVDKTTVPALASIASGASVQVTVPFTIPRVAAKGSGESDADYLARLASVEGSTLQATATASGTSSGGPISAGPAVSPATTLHLPIMGIAKSGPANADAGTTQTYPLALHNSGGATAGPLTVTDSVPDGTTGTVTGVPATLAPAASATAQASFAIPLDQPNGGLTDTASVAWQDANGDTYGPVSSMFTTQVRASLVGATLTLSPASAGPDVVGTQQTLTATFLDRNGNPLSGKTVSFAVTGANPATGTGVTDSNGVATFTYTGANTGVDTAQASFTQGSISVQSNTATVGWIIPITPISTSTVTGNFFAESATPTTFVAKPGDSPAFGQNFPTIDFNPPSGANLWLGNDTSGNFFQTDSGGVVLSQQSLAVTGVAWDGSNLYVGDGQGGITKRTADGATVVDSMSIAHAGTPSEDLAWDTKRNVLWRIDHDPPTLDEIDPVAHTLLHAYPLPTSDGAAPAMTPLGGLGLAYDPSNDRLYLSFCQHGCSNLGQGVVRIADPTTGSITGDLFQSPFMTGGLAIDTGSDTLWVGGDGTVRNTTLHGQVLSSFARPQPGGFVDGLEIVRTAKTPIVNHNISGVGPQTRPFTDVTTDQLGNFTGTIVAQGNGVQAGVGPLTNFDAELSASFTVAKAGDVTFDVVADDGFMLGIGGGATRVSGAYENAPASNTSPFLGYPLAGAFNQQGGNTPGTYPVTVHFPAAGNYPYELDYFECCGSELSLTMTIEQFTADTSPLSVYVGYADGLRPAGSVFPFPWQGSPGVTFDGNGSTPYDSGALRFDNSSGSTITLGDVSVDVGSAHFDLWGNNVQVAPHAITILTQTSGNNFDSSDQPITCTPTGVIPQVHYTPTGGTTTTFADTTQVLNTKGIDPPSCGGGNESISWTRIGGGGTPINVPLPPAAALSLTPTTVSGDTVGNAQTLTVTALDGSGNPVANLPVAFGVFGVNTQSLSATTDATGTARTSYVGTNPGTDTVTATAFISGLRNVSNALTIPWVIPAPASQPPPTSSGPTAPQIASLVPANGTVVSSPTPVTATITAPAGGSIASYTVTLQNTADSSTTTIGSGSGTPPTPLANLDPALFASGTYVLAVSATSGAGGTATLSNLVVLGTGGGTAAQTPPTISPPSPPDGTVVKVPVPITATLTPPSGQTIASWNVTAQALDVEPPITLASGTGTPPTPLATLDPSVLANDTYAITVSATASGGGTQSITATLAVAGNLKLGRYVTSFDDLDVPVNGFPMQVHRSYDSIDSRVGDFGVGWQVSISNFRVSSNRALGLGGWTVKPTQCFFGLCLYGFTSSAAHYVTVTFPDNHQETFDFTPANTGGPLFYWQGNAAFTPRQGVTSTLQAEGDTGLTYGFDGNLYDGNFDPYNPTAFVLTTADGRVLHLTTTAGLVSETDAQGNTLSVDSGGVHSSNGQSITFARDSAGRITTTTGPSGQTIAYSYSGAGDLASVTDADGNLTSYTYDSNHHLLSVSGPGRPQRTLTYDSSGRLVAITDAAGDIAHISSDVTGRQQIVQDPNGRLSTVDTFDDAGDLLREDKVFGTTTQTTTWTYDSVGHMLTQTDPNGGVITFTYNAAGAVLSTTDAAGHLSAYTRNSFGEPLTVVGPDGVTQLTLVYDAHGRLLTQTRADGAHSSYAYDSSGNLLTSTDELGRVTSRAYDSAGHPTSVTDPAGHVTAYTYDASGHPLQITDPLGRVTAFTYDGNGHITQITDPQGRVQSFSYDAVGHIISATDASGKVTAYTYDSVGRRVKRVDRNGGATAYTYDADSSITSETLPDASQTTYTYDALERPATITNPAESIHYTYNAMGAVTSQATTPNGGSGLPSVTLSYTYDPAGAQLSEAGPDGTTTYAYDADSRLTTLTAPGSQTYGFGYDAAGRLSSETRPDGVADTLAYDAAGDLTGRTSRLGATVVAQANYTYDAGGLRASLTDLGGTHSYTYDAAGELLSATHPASSGLAAESYTYNASGDRASSASDPAGSIHYDAGGRLTSDAAHSYVYDAEGDMVSSTLTATGATTTYSWDADHRLLGVTHPDASTSHYTYDGLGRRVAVQDPAATTRYAYDGSNVHLEYDGSNALQAAYAETLTLGGVIAQTRGGQNFGYVQDGLGSTTALLDGSGNVSSAYGYDSFGRQASGNPSSPQQTFSYTGQSYDASTGLYYDRARYYDPGTGRFLSEDPVQHANRYAYVGNDPTNLVDPTGAQELVEESETIAIDEEIDAAALEEEQTALCEEGSVLGRVLGEGLSANEKGSLAEKYVSDNFLNGLPKNTDVLSAPSGAGRIPDFVNEGGQFFEVKNVGYLSYTQQLKDFVALAGDGNPLTIFTRGSTNISGPLAQAARDGDLNIVKCLPG